MHHIKDGIFVQRNPDGSVQIIKCESATANPSAVIFSMHLTVEEFAAGVAAVSSDGDTPDTYRRALDLHKGR